MNTPTKGQIEDFRKEQHIPGPDLEPWAVESNMVLDYLCRLALDKASVPPEALRRDVPPEIFDSMAVYMELHIEKNEMIKPSMVADVLDALMRLIRKRWKAEAAESPRGEKT